MLQISSLQISGFRSVSSAMPLHIDVGRGAFLVEGLNGAGKTTLACEALYWLLFGKSLRGSSIATVVNRDADEAVVIGKFVRDDGVSIVVTRRRTKGGKHTFSMTDGAGKDLLAASGVGTTVTAKGDVVCTLLNLTSEIVKATTFYSPTESLLALKDTARRELLEGLLEMEWVDTAREVTKSKLTTIREEQADLTKKIAYSEGVASTYLSEGARLRADAESLQGRINVGVDAIRDAIGAIDVRKQGLVAHLASQDGVTAHFGALGAGARAEVQRLTAAVEAFTSDQRTLRQKLQGFHAVSTMQTRALDKANAELDRMRSTVTCPMCAQALPEDYYKEAMMRAIAEQAKAQASLDKMARQVAEVEAELAAVEGTLVGIRARQQEAQESLTNITTQLANAARIKATVEKELGMLAVERARRETELLAVDNLEDAKAKLLADAVAKEQEATSYQRRVEEATRRRDDILAVEFDKVNWWHHAFGPKGIRAFALEGLVYDITRRANEYLRFMSEERLTLEASTTKLTAKGEVSETLDFRVVNSMGIDTYADASTGERRLADIALTVALYDATIDLSGVGGLGYMVFDEALDSLDPTYAQAVVDLFTKLGQRGICIGTISHSEEVQGNFPVAWKVGRGDDGWTTLVVTEKMLGRQASESEVLPCDDTGEGRVKICKQPLPTIPEAFGKYGADEAVARLNALINEYPPGVPAEFSSKDVQRIREAVDAAVERYGVARGIQEVEAVYRLFTNNSSGCLERLAPIAMLDVAYRLGACFEDSPNEEGQ